MGHSICSPSCAVCVCVCGEWVGGGTQSVLLAVLCVCVCVVGGPLNLFSLCCACRWGVHSSCQVTNDAAGYHRQEQVGDEVGTDWRNKVTIAISATVRAMVVISWKSLEQKLTEYSFPFSVAYQRISWEALKKSINGLVNKVRCCLRDSSSAVL